MFGLDARIALAIFGALSVISGAALYSAIQNSTVIKYLATVNEIEKSLISYYLDTGLYPNFNDTIHAEVMVSGLFTDDGNSGWNGPYSVLKLRNALTIDDPYDSDNPLDLIIRLGDRESSNSFDRDACVTNNPKLPDCSLWIEWYTIPENIVTQISVQVDGNDDILNGKVRYCELCGGARGSMFYRFDF